MTPTYFLLNNKLINMQGGVNLDSTIKILVGIIILAILGIIQYIAIKTATKKKVLILEGEAEKLVENAKKEAESTKKEAILEAKEEVHKLRSDLDRDSRDRRNEIQRLERRILQREEALDKKSDLLEKI